ncbi:MAG: hypothetical protein HY076_09050 [Candidatus Eisenbacteria bacterium]|uniref:Uncharacterized protein n=1 Tax=Eiseniibacteriota bacterium TaxID=2212470 RepID=A0A9D6LA66_UNCEI|nr:hypothetical protein [Candidatus Eisenbacteria bacterium]MBI3540405.1 hypothetical protein [Candidatus Eisenbacteria bacterium]
MTQTQTLRKLQRDHWRKLRRLFKQAYQEGMDAGRARAHGQGRQGRTIRDDATVNGLVRRIQRHFGLDRYNFEVRVVHAGSGRRVAGADLLRKYRVDERD